MKNKIDIVLAPELLNAYQQKESVAVVIDVLRASATIVTALHNGANAIFPLETIEEAEQFAQQGKIVGAERNVERCSFARYGNDPFEYTPETVKGEEIYFTTTNGTRTIKACMQAGYETVIGTFINLSAVAEYCQNRDVLAVCAGWQGKPSKEDALFAAALCDKLVDTHDIQTDISEMITELWRIHTHELLDYVRDSNHFPRIVKAGKDNSYEYCMTEDVTDRVPVASITEEGLIKLR